MKSVKIIIIDDFDQPISVGKRTIIRHNVDIFDVLSDISKKPDYISHKVVLNKQLLVNHILIVYINAILVLKTIESNKELKLIKLDNGVRKAYFYVLPILLIATLLLLILSY